MASVDWNTGYVTDVDYTFGYYGDLNPLRARLPLLLAGIHAPNVETACELGFGQGLSVAMHAAAQPGVSWWGTDFNPNHAAYASDLVRQAGANAKLFDEAFAEFCNRSDLPDFDFIGLHGVWSWISDENRRVLVDFIRRRLRPGGVVFASYNTEPGWSATAPLRHLIKRHAEVMAPPGHGVLGQTEAALTFAGEFLALKPLWEQANPSAVQRLEKLRGQDRRYLAHEYMNRDWKPMHFADVEAWLAGAKISFAASAQTLDALAEIHLTPEQAQFIAAIPDASLRETARDYSVNRQFRRDYWIRGARRLVGIEQLAALRQQRVILTVPAAEVPDKVRGSSRQATLVPAIYRPVIDVLSDNKPISIEELEAALGGADITPAQLHSALLILLGLGVLSPAATSQEATRASAQTKALNKAIVQRTASVADIGHLVSPVLGGGLQAGRFHQLFWSAQQQGAKGPAEWAGATWRLLQSQGQALIKDGVTLEGEDNLKELIEEAEQWRVSILPIWDKLGL